jgi:hypothetical protein
MNIHTTRLGITICVILMSAGPIFSQTADATTDTTAAIATADDVYVQTSKGVNVYTATAAGKLTLLNGSPFKVTGQLGGVTGSHLISVGTTDLHTYQVESNGAVGSEIATVDTATYDPEDCGPTTGNRPALDHTGKYFYVQLSYGPGGTGCGVNDWQSYQIGTNGDFTFLGNDYSNDGENFGTTALTIDSSDMYGYSFSQEIGGNSDFSPFVRLSNGALTYNTNMGEKDPKVDPSLDYYLLPFMATEDPHEHLAVLMGQCVNNGDEGCEPTGKDPQLASYTISTSTGSISSSNTEDNIPYLDIANPIGMDMSYDGKFVAISGKGFQVFNFNGAAVATKLTGRLLPGIQIDQITWDKLDHLYALSYEAGKLYVFTVSAHGATQVESIGVSGGYGNVGIVVVPK